MHTKDIKRHNTVVHPGIISEGEAWYTTCSTKYTPGFVVLYLFYITGSLQWRHNGRDSVSNHQLHDCLLNRLFRRRSKKTSKLCVTGLSAGNSPGTGEFPAQVASDAENVSIWWRHHVLVNWVILFPHCSWLLHWHRGTIPTQYLWIS